MQPLPRVIGPSGRAAICPAPLLQGGLFALAGAVWMLLLDGAVAQQAFPPPPPPPASANAAQDAYNYTPQAFGPPAVFAPPSVAPTEPTTAPTAPQTAPAQVTTQAEPLEGGKILARVGRGVILASDVLWQVEKIIDSNRGKFPPEEEDKLREMLLQQQVVGMIDTKLLYAEFLRNVPAENIPKIEESLQQPFEEQEVPRLMKALGLKHPNELAHYLREHGSSLADARRQFIERTIAGEWLRQKVPEPKPVTHQDMLDYYHEHLPDFDYPAKARWEELMVRFDKYGSRVEAVEAICSMGNQVWESIANKPTFRGPAFAEVATNRSDGFTAQQGGQHDWTTKGAMRCAELDAALFSLKLGQMSDVITSEQGLHIVRVLERKEAGRTPFTEAQADIRDKLTQEHRKGLVEEQFDKLRRAATVWTVWEGNISGEALAERMSSDARR